MFLATLILTSNPNNRVTNPGRLTWVFGLEKVDFFIVYNKLAVSKAAS